MRFSTSLFIALALSIPAAAVHAENGSIVRAGELKAQPFIDAATTDRLAAKQTVAIVTRKGGWLQVQSNGKTGWVRLTNVKLETRAAGTRPAAQNASLLRTGSSGRTTTTGIKGVNEEDIKNAVVNDAEVARLASLAVPANEGTSYARQNGLQENQVEYLKAGKSK